MRKIIALLLVSVIPIVSACGASGGGGFDGDISMPAIYGAVSQDSGRFGVMMVSFSGETLLPIMDRSGLQPKLAGALWTDEEGGSVAIYLGDDGLPSRVVWGDYVLLFTNWDAAAKTVDIAKVYTPKNHIEIYREVVIADQYAGLLTEQNASASKSTCFPACDTDLKNLAELVKFAGLGISLGACGVAIPVSLGAMLLPCSGVVVASASIVVGDESWLDNLDKTGNVLTSIDLFKCAFSDVGSCVSLAVDLSGKALDAADGVLNDNEPVIDAADIFLADPNQHTGVAQQGFGINSCPTNDYQCTPGAYLPCYPEGTKQCAANCKWPACPVPVVEAEPTNTDDTGCFCEDGVTSCSSQNDCPGTPNGIGGMIPGVCFCRVDYL